MTPALFNEDNGLVAAQKTPVVQKDNAIKQQQQGDHDSTSKSTISTAPLTHNLAGTWKVTAVKQYPGDSSNSHDEVEVNFAVNADSQVPVSTLTMASSGSFDTSPNNTTTNIVEVLDESMENPVPSSCSSPYQAFLFSSEWLGSGELQLPDMGSSSSQNSANNRSNDDADSVASGAYFDPVDLAPSNWRKAISMGPTFGFALVALATILVNPVIFVAGAFAFGTLHAAGMGYDYCTAGAAANAKNKNDDNASTTTSLSSSEIAASWEQVLLSICYKELPVEEAEKVIAESKESSAATASLPELKEDPAVISNSLILAPPTSSALTKGVSDKTLPENASKYQQQETAPAERLNIPTRLNVEAKPLTKQDVDQVYPSLETTVVKDVSFPGLHAIEFFRVFFADDAPYNFMELQKQRGDLDIHYGQWKSLGVEDPIMLHHDTSQHHCTVAAAAADHQSRKSSFQGRVLTFKAKTNNFVGPLYANTRKTQRVLLHHKTLIVMESRTDLKEIPFCDKFYVLERWVIRAEKIQDGSKYKYVSTLSATSEVVFTQSCSFAGQIRSKSAATIKELVKCWCSMAKEALKLTEQRKTLRLQHEQEELDSDVENDTENEEEPLEDHGSGRMTNENTPPTSHEEEGIEMTWPAENDVSISSHAGGRPNLKHSGSFPLPSYRGKTLQGIRRSVSSLFTNTNSSNKR